MFMLFKVLFSFRFLSSCEGLCFCVEVRYELFGNQLVSLDG